MDPLSCHSCFILMLHTYSGGTTHCFQGFHGYGGVLPAASKQIFLDLTPRRLMSHLGTYDCASITNIRSPTWFVTLALLLHDS